MRANGPRRDERREERIRMEIIVDAYGSKEQAMSWYYYLEQQLRFPFKALSETMISLMACVFGPVSGAAEGRPRNN